MEKFVIDAEKVLQLISRESRRAVVKMFIDSGIVVEKLAERPGSCSGCIFEMQTGCPIWDICSVNDILIFNHHSKFYVKEDSK